MLELNPAGKFPSLAEQALVLAREFRDRGSLFLPAYLGPLDAEFKDRHAKEGLSVLELDLRRMRWAVLRQLLAIVQANRVEVVHWNFYGPFANGYVWALSLLAPRLEHFYTDHISRPPGAPVTGKASRLRWALKRPLIRRYARVFCISEYVKRELKMRYWRNLCVLHNFINSDRFCPDPQQRREVRRSYGAREEFIALAVAYLIPEKGVEVAVRALAELPAEVVLWIVGDGPDRANLEALACQLNLGERVRFLGCHTERGAVHAGGRLLHLPVDLERGSGQRQLRGDVVRAA